MDECPFCRAADDDGYFYNCITTREPSELNGDLVFDRSNTCYEAEISQLKARNELLEEVAEAAENYFNLDPGDTGYVSAKTVLWDALAALEKP